MDLTVKSRNGKITERQRQHIEEKLGKLGRYMDQITSATVEIRTEQQRQAGEVHRVQVTLTGDRGVILRAEEQASDLYGAIDEVQSVLQRQIQRYKEKYWRRERQRRQPDKLAVVDMPAVAVEEPPPVEETERRDMEVIRTKKLTLRPMFVDDAIEQMELLGHSFFVFQDAETEQVSVLYRRRDGNYGMLVPDTI
ncbi:sigma 54 modulation protein/ribosomal protein S30EA [Oscillochloris trichoides DG-6]|uniref:Ribosome hibernation promoting factor n=1 Tax=Oscillochloris trichoides DG-6 TaxID=765420 RepID=E1IBX3_9CHLR|nr:ribosome-associated translation inhibitor RaiA [Oscillochloris trichoides]EFO81301.1 sigma 54 modulation protein/ribosomal protein S30EA [Oscillochloris trichoides DG-6]